ncbi:MAG: hypothetical protein DWG76_01290 [Chloroflexi bacterium]|nr:hypothetical protein [Chloroflexota bacterium]
MNSKSMRSIEEQIGRRFPEVAGARPKVTQQKSAGASNYLLTFHGRAEGPGGRSLNRTVRVVANENGKILKVSTSR